MSAVPSFAAGWLVPRLQRFRQQCPALDILLHASEELVDLEHSRVDLGIRYGTGNYPGLISERLFVDELFPVYSPGLLKGQASLKKLSPVTYVANRYSTPTGLRNEGSGQGWTEWVRAAGAAGIDVTKGLRFSDGALAIQAAVGGQGVALGSRALTLEHLAGGRLVRPFKLSLVTDFAYYAACAKSRADEPDIVAFRRWLIAEAQSAPAA